MFGGDSYPNKWFIERSKGADFVIHECFYTPEGLASYLGFPPLRPESVRILPGDLVLPFIILCRVWRGDFRTGQGGGGDALKHR